MKYVTKRDGTKEDIDAEKIHEKVILACEDITGVSASEIEINANFQFVEGIKTDDIQKILIRSAHDLITEDDPHYDIVASRLLNQQIRKEVYCQYTPKPLYDTLKKNTKNGIYDSILLESYSQEEIEYFNSKIKYDRDDKFSYAGLKQLYEKYLIKRKGVIIESPQDANMIINMMAFVNYPEKDRKYWVVQGYEILSRGEVSHPTPTMVGLRSQFRRYISCNLIDYGDSTESISKANYATTMCTASRSGIGFNHGGIRGLGADIDEGRVTHTGIIPIIKGSEVLTKSFSQEMRGGGGTNFYPFFHKEILDLLVLKNNKGTEENRARQLDHTLQVNKLFYERLWENKNDGMITLFYTNDAPDLYNLMGDSEKFKERYEHYEKTLPKRKKFSIPASEIWELFKDERGSTGRIYLVNQDDFNTHSSFKIPVKQSNLCLEISVPSRPLDNSEGPGEIGVCILASINWGHCDEKRLPLVTEYLVRFLEELIEFQEYAMPEIEYAAKKRRTLGIGDSDVFHWLAKNKLFYNTIDARNAAHKYKEKIAYGLIDASCRIAEDKGACELFGDTKYSDGLLTIDTYNKNVDELVSVDLELDWDELRERVLKYGMRHSTLMAVAPTANSARVSNSTPGIEPPRRLLNVKEDKKVIIKQLVPEYTRLKNYYSTAWSEDFNNVDYFKLVSIVQKFTDQSISTNQFTDFTRYPDGYPDELLEEEYYTAYRYGIKTLYYQVFNTGDTIEEEDDGCAGGGCKI